MKDDRVYLEHIANSFRKLLEYAEGMTLEEFLADSKTQDACVRQLEIAGEATKRVSMPLQERFADIPWKDMAGMRDRLIHQYDRRRFDDRLAGNYRRRNSTSNFY